MRRAPPLPMLLALLLALLLAAAALPCAAQPEEALKAQVIQRVLLFVKWPPKLLVPGQALELCLADDTPLAAALGRSAGLSPQGLTLRTRQVAIGEIDGCHALYLGRHAAVLPAVPRRSGLLLIGDAHGLLERGVMLNVLLDKGRVAFDIGLPAAREAGLEISVQVLRLARFVKDA